MPEIKLNLRANLLRLFRYLSAIILNYLNQFRKKSNKKFVPICFVDAQILLMLD
ncbi:hypothetical protein [Orientia tsutsugamushi]|uniref:hypothetical protein n=1 Tax=Orientia tsutsugamushi TaxID=784 RepID=UPI000D5A35F6|nr:replicative DNA helicase [Orientia tsutsugamushi]